LPKRQLAGGLAKPETKKVGTVAQTYTIYHVQQLQHVDTKLHGHPNSSSNFTG